MEEFGIWSHPELTTRHTCFLLSSPASYLCHTRVGVQTGDMGNECAGIRKVEAGMTSGGRGDDKRERGRNIICDVRKIVNKRGSE